jgi:hypothetical protein
LLHSRGFTVTDLEPIISNMRRVVRVVGVVGVVDVILWPESPFWKQDLASCNYADPLLSLREKHLRITVQDEG